MKKKTTYFADICFERRILTVSEYYNHLFVYQFCKILKVQSLIA